MAGAAVEVVGAGEGRRGGGSAGGVDAEPPACGEAPGLSLGASLAAPPSRSSGGGRPASFVEADVPVESAGDGSIPVRGFVARGELGEVDVLGLSLDDGAGSADIVEAAGVGGGLVSSCCIAVRTSRTAVTVTAATPSRISLRLRSVGSFEGAAGSSFATFGTALVKVGRGLCPSWIEGAEPRPGKLGALPRGGGGSTAGASASAIASPRSSQLAKRSTGDLASARANTSSTAAGRPLRDAKRSGGS